SELGIRPQARQAIYFVEVTAEPELHAARADEGALQHRACGEFPLQAEVEVQAVRILHMRVDQIIALDLARRRQFRQDLFVEYGIAKTQGKAFGAAEDDLPGNVLRARDGAVVVIGRLDSEHHAEPTANHGPGAAIGIEAEADARAEVDPRIVFHR